MTKLESQIDEATAGGQRLKDELNRFYYDMSINEMRLMNSSFSFPNITYNSLLYLDIIAYKEQCTVSYLAGAFNVAKSAVTLKVNELIKQGFVDKTQSKIDKRINYLTVKPEVIAEYKVYDDALHNAISSVEANYSQHEIEKFCEMLEFVGKKLYGNP